MLFAYSRWDTHLMDRQLANLLSFWLQDVYYFKIPTASHLYSLC